MPKARKPKSKPVKKRKTKAAPKRDFAQIAFDAVKKATEGQ
jgi:hypothetical protein